MAVLKKKRFSFHFNNERKQINTKPNKKLTKQNQRMIEEGSSKYTMYMTSSYHKLKN